MKAEINTGVVKGLKYKAGTKESDPAAIGQLVVEFDADEADAAEVAALIGQGVTITLESPQVAMFTRVDQRTGEIG